METTCTCKEECEDPNRSYEHFEDIVSEQLGPLKDENDDLSYQINEEGQTHQLRITIQEPLLHHHGRETAVSQEAHPSTTGLIPLAQIKEEPDGTHDNVTPGEADAYASWETDAYASWDEEPPSETKAEDTPGETDAYASWDEEHQHR